MEKFDIMLCAMVFGTATAMAQAKFTSLPEGCVVKNVSPNGSYVIGNAGTFGDDALSSFVWNSATGEISWKTNSDDDDENGQFLGVNDNGCVVGSMKDKDLKRDYPATDWNDAYTLTFRSAALWKNGTVTKLGVGDLTAADFDEDGDGSYAVAVSADESVVAGYIYKYYMPTVPCGWKWNVTDSKYEYFNYKVPAGAVGSVNALSADGSVAAGVISYGGVKRPVVWTSPEQQPKELLLGMEASSSDIWDASATSISASGKYVLLYVTGPKSHMALYDTTTDRYTEVPVENVSSLKTLAVDDNGNFFCRISSSIDYTEKTFYYSFADKSLIALEYFASVYAPGASAKLYNGSSIPAAVSADGTVVIGNDSQYDSSWCLKRNLEGVMAPAADNVAAHFTGVGNVAVTYDKVADVPAGLTLKSYNLYVDNEKVASNAADKSARFDIDVAAGSHSMFVKAAYDKDGNEVESDKSAEVKVVAPSSYSMPLKENFESSTFDTNYWTRELVSGNSSEVLLWNVSGGDYQDNTYFANVTNTANKPYKATLTSRFISADKDGKAPYLTFYAMRKDVNTVQHNLSSDGLSVEYSTDGETWNALRTIWADETNMYNWAFYRVDLKDLAGKDFQLRFVASSEGFATLRWALDYINVDTEYSGATPEGVRLVKSGNSAKVEWKNSVGAYEVSRLNNSNVITDYNVGNSGSPMMTAVDFPADKMKDYVGMYITSVSDFIYDAPNYYGGETNNTKAEVFVYADGEKVATGKFADDCATEVTSSVAPLDKAVKIEAGKSYRVAVRIYEYDADQAPLYYQSGDTNPEYKTGETDLYSEDDGETWSTIYEFNKDDNDPNRAYCVWPIRMNVTEDATLPEVSRLSGNLVACNVLENGEPVNTLPVYAANSSYVVDNYVEGAEYRVQAFYNDCSVSAESDAASVVVTAISANRLGGNIGVAVDAAGKTIAVNGSFDNATVVDVAGNVLLTTSSSLISTNNLPAGVYILNVVKDGRKNVYKVAVR